MQCRAGRGRALGGGEGPLVAEPMEHLGRVSCQLGLPRTVHGEPPLGIGGAFQDTVRTHLTSLLLNRE